MPAVCLQRPQRLRRRFSPPHLPPSPEQDVGQHCLGLRRSASAYTVPDSGGSPACGRGQGQTAPGDDDQRRSALEPARRGRGGVQSVEAGLAAVLPRVGQSGQSTGTPSGAMESEARTDPPSRTRFYTAHSCSQRSQSRKPSRRSRRSSPSSPTSSPLRTPPKPSSTANCGSRTPSSRAKSSRPRTAPAATFSSSAASGARCASLKRCSCGRRARAGSSCSS